jgi:hypothetical protein
MVLNWKFAVGGLKTVTGSVIESEHPYDEVTLSFTGYTPGKVYFHEGSGTMDVSFKAVVPKSHFHLLIKLLLKPCGIVDKSLN